MKHARDDYNRIQDPKNLIPEDEPVFLIRSMDSCGPAAVAVWAMFAEMAGAYPDIVQKAREHSEAMKQWQRENRCHTPDL